MNINVNLLRLALHLVRKQYQKYTYKIKQIELKRETLGEEFDAVMRTVDIPNFKPYKLEPGDTSLLSEITKKDE